MSSSISATPTLQPSPTATPIPEEEEYYSSWSLFLVCGLLVLSLWTSYYLQIKRIRAIHETFVAIIGGMFVGLVVRLAPGTMIREMLVSAGSTTEAIKHIGWSSVLGYLSRVQRVHAVRRLHSLMSSGTSSNLMTHCSRSGDIVSNASFRRHCANLIESFTQAGSLPCFCCIGIDVIAAHHINCSLRHSNIRYSSTSCCRPSS